MPIYEPRPNNTEMNNNLPSLVNYIAGHSEQNSGAPFFFVRSATELAKMVVDAEAVGTLDGWRPYIRDLQVRSGISNAEMADALKKKRAAQS